MLKYTWKVKQPLNLLKYLYLWQFLLYMLLSEPLMLNLCYKLSVKTETQSAKVAFVRPPLPHNNNQTGGKCPAKGLPVYLNGPHMQ